MVKRLSIPKDFLFGVDFAKYLQSWGVSFDIKNTGRNATYKITGPERVLNRISKEVEAGMKRKVKTVRGRSL